MSLYSKATASRQYTVSGRCLLTWMVISLAASTSVARSANIPEIADRLVMAEEIERTYIDPLGLRGLSGATAVERLLAEGFRCRIETAEEHAPEDSAMWYCAKRPSRMPAPCEELRVALRFGPPAQNVKQRAALLAGLNDIKVTSVHASCPGPRFVSTAYVAARSAAEKSLTDLIAAFDIRGSGDIAYRSLLIEGFYCGFVVSERAQESPRMECTKLPSHIKFCYEARVTFEMAWPASVSRLEQLYKALPESRVTSTRATCEVPPMNAGQKAPF